MDQFKEIRPYQDDEIRPVVDALLENPEFTASIASFYYPRLSRFFAPVLRRIARKRLESQVSGVHDVASMQDVIATYMDKMIEDTTTALTHSGLDKLDPDASYLFISNHRDIAMDPAFVNYMLYHNGMETLQIAIGDNLLKKPFVTDLMRLNKSFIVRRSLKGRELLKSLNLLSGYIHHCIDNNHNVWIAQREGRAKNGVDRTDPALLKMLARGRQGVSLKESLNGLHIIPVAISYEYDACDELKANELYQMDAFGKFEKNDQSDIQSIVTGMMGYKGDVHVAFGTQLIVESDDPDAVARQIDNQILNNYQLHTSNYTAMELLVRAGDIEEEAGVAVINQKLDLASKKAFENRIAAIDPKLHKFILKMYANPVISKNHGLKESSGQPA